MATPPLPASPCLRVRMLYDLGGVGEMSNRFYLKYSGSAPTGANCTTLAGDILGAWESHLASLIGANNALNEVDVLDIATDSGASGNYTGAGAGTYGSPYMPIQCATNVEFDIARRYRGGKPRWYLPPPGTAAQYNDAQYNSTFVGAANTGVAGFFTEVAGLSVGSLGTLSHVSLSFYQGYINVEVPGTRAYAKPQYRATALVDTVEGYATKVLISSQRRRRTSTTP